MLKEKKARLEEKINWDNESKEKCIEWTFKVKEERQALQIEVEQMMQEKGWNMDMEVSKLEQEVVKFK